MTLHQVMINTIPDFDGYGSCNPELEVYKEGELVFSSVVRKKEMSSHVTGGDFAAVESSSAIADIIMACAPNASKVKLSTGCGLMRRNAAGLGGILLWSNCDIGNFL